MAPDRLPLPAQLSAALVAFTIEADNEVERTLAHRTSFHARGGRGVWLTSMAMWFNCLRGLADAGGELTVAELEAVARMATNLDGVRRWGYVTIDGIGRVARGSGERPHARRSSVLALTERGAVAEATWRPVPAAIEERWRARFGGAEVDDLREALLEIARRDDAALPDFMPIDGPGRPRMGRDSEEVRGPDERDADARLALVSLLARVLLRFMLDHDAQTRLPLVAWSNLVRVLDDTDAVAVRDLPTRTGISKEWLAVLTKRLTKAGLVLEEPLAGASRGRQLRLTETGVRARGAGVRRIDATVAEWEARFGAGAVSRVSDALAPIVGDGTRESSPLWAGLTPPEDGWRAQVPAPERLPWYPMVTHRGGYPDGS